MDLNSVYDKVRKNVVCQDKPIKELILTVDHNLRDGHFNKQNVILRGDRGTGKTLMCEMVAKEMGIPFTQIDVSLSHGRLTSEHMDEALTSFANQLDSSEVSGIVLFDGFDKLLSENMDNNILRLTRRNNYLVANDRLQTFDMFDLSKVTFVAEGTYDSKATGFNSNFNIMNDSLFSSKFNRLITTNPVDEELVTNAILFSNISALRNIGDITISDEEINKMVAMIIERGVGLHSAPAVISEVLYPKFEKKYFG